MSGSAGTSWRAMASAIAVLLPALALGACSSQSDVMAEKVAAAEAAAAKAIAAQEAAEKAAATLANAPPPAPRVEPTVMADTPGDFSEQDQDDGNPGNGSASDNDFSMGGDGQSSTDGIPNLPHGA